ncbi:MAG TPA: hypothetical protein VGF28_04650 [Thermoanaerobaculia bacterium]|jgi:hypothetical protein
MLLLVAVTASAAAQSTGLTLRLESDFSEKLPGEPVPLRLVAENHTMTARVLPFSVFIHASREGAESFLGGINTGWWRDLTDDELSRGEDGSLPIAPGASATAEWDVGSAAETPYFLLDPFLYPPGRYTLRVLASVDDSPLRDLLQGPTTLQAVLEAIPDTTISTPLTLDVLEPQGVDAEAWAWIRRHIRHERWSSRLSGYGHDIRQHFPESNYFFSFGLADLREVPLAELEALEARARARKTRPPLLDSVQFAIAGHHRSRCSRHYMNKPRNVAAAAEACETARAALARLAQESPSARKRAAAAKAASETMTAEGVRKFIIRLDAHDAGTFQGVVPLLQCVRESGRRLEATFAYRNDNPFDVPIVGASNVFSPGPEDRGQPTKFLPGLHENVITIVVEGKKNDPARTITWTLDGRSASAPSATAPRCKGK